MGKSATLGNSGHMLRFNATMTLARVSKCVVALCGAELCQFGAELCQFVAEISVLCQFVDEISVLCQFVAEISEFKRTSVPDDARTLPDDQKTFHTCHNVEQTACTDGVLVLGRWDPMASQC